MKWATRAGVHIDRATCAWLIRRHIDADAEFVFVGAPGEVPADALHHAPASRRSAGKILAVGLVAWWLPVAAVALFLGTGSVFSTQGLFFSGTALVAFGGAYAVLALWPSAPWRRTFTWVWGPVTVQLPELSTLSPIALAITGAALVMTFVAKWPMLRILGICALLGMGTALP